jgi:isopentenyl-diphosphate delta-isomerase
MSNYKNSVRKGAFLIKRQRIDAIVGCMADTEKIVFVDEAGRPTGETGPKLASHTADTRLHLAFSCYIFRRSDNAFLMTRRALSKKVWPGVWTNSVCGHPMPGEAIKDAIHRRAAFELGLDKLDGLQCVLPKYTYKTPPYQGIIEHEFCPVFTAYTASEPRPNPEEVETSQWVPWPEYTRFLAAEPAIISYWTKDQHKQLCQLEFFRSLKEQST